MYIIKLCIQVSAFFDQYMLNLPYVISVFLFLESDMPIFSHNTVVEPNEVRSLIANNSFCLNHCLSAIVIEKREAIHRS